MTPTDTPPRTMQAVNVQTGKTMTITADHMPPKVARRVMVVGSGMALGAFLAGGNLTAAAISIANGVTPDKFDSIADALAGSCKVSMQPGAIDVPLESVYDSVFYGNHSAFVEWFVFAVRWNFESFFDDLSSGKLAGRIQGKPPAENSTSAPKG